MARTDKLLSDSSMMELVHSPSPSSGGHNQTRTPKSSHKRKTTMTTTTTSSTSASHHHHNHSHRKEKKVKKQRMWKSLSKVLRRPISKSSYAALYDDESNSKSPISSLDYNGNHQKHNLADEIDWKHFSINSDHTDDKCETIGNANALNHSIGVGSSHHSSHTHHSHRRPAASATIGRHVKNSMDSDSSSTQSDASTIHNNNDNDRSSVRHQLETRKVQAQIEYYESMNRMRPRIERVMDKLESYLDAKLNYKPSHDLRFL